MGISNIIFIILFIGAVVWFAFNVKKIISNIQLGRKVDRSDNTGLRWKTMIKVALGQSKMTARPVAGLLHIVVYAGFVIINLEMLEIVIDGISGSHRVFEPLLGGLYSAFINVFELLALGVLIGCVIFFIRRNILRIPRFHKAEMKTWPKSDANIILVIEILLMTAFLTMNAADTNTSGNFLVSSGLKGFLPIDENSLYLIERSCWWFHILGVLGFLNYLPYSKHFHILLAFPATYYSNLLPKGQFTNMHAVTNEVKLMFDPNADPYAAAPEPDPNAEVVRFGAKEVNDLTWKNLMDSYSCTECGRCSSECPANQTGKLLSPRKIMMDTRDRLEEFGANKGVDDGKSLLHDYITTEELRACTTCNACTQACPINLDPLSIIMEMRRYLIMEESNAPQEWNGMATNIENNGAPWQFAQADRLNWATEE